MNAENKLFVMRLLTRFKELLFPPNANCMGCSSPLGAEEDWLCQDCLDKLKPMAQSSEARCARCGSFLNGKGRCPGCRDWPADAISFSRFVFLYQPPIRGMIHQLKYHSVGRMAPCLARYMANMMIYENFSRPDILVPVPMHKSRIKKRGYNHADLLAREMGKLLDIPVEENILVRTRNTAQQAKQSGKKRRQSLANAFSANGAEGKCVLLVDDVITTGATIIHCAHALKKAGAVDVQAIALAGTPK